MIIGDRISTTLFSYDSERRMFVTEDSSLRGFNPMGQLWDDSCDQGFVMVSAKTGKEVPFYFQSARHDEYDIQYWDFVSYRITPEVFVRVYNN